MSENKSKYENDAEYHRRKTWSNDDRAIDARNRLAENIHKQNQLDGGTKTWDSALNKATEIANKIYRERQEKGER